MIYTRFFFDGKIFVYLAKRAAKAANLLALCDGNMALTKRVERFRQAVLEGIRPNFVHFGPPMAPLSTPNGGMRMGRGGRRPIYAAGGHLEVAGVVVGSWGPNYGNNVKPPQRSKVNKSCYL